MVVEGSVFECTIVVIAFIFAMTVTVYEEGVFPQLAVFVIYFIIAMTFIVLVEGVFQ